MSFIKITKEFSFDSAHKLINYEGKCGNLHGHTYLLHVTLQGEIDENGFLMDFATVKSIVKKDVINVLDHKYLNDIIEQPTAENITLWIWNVLVKKFGDMLNEIKLWETPTSFVTYNG